MKTLKDLITTMFKSPENDFSYVEHDRKFFVMPAEMYEEYMQMPRTTSTLNFTKKVDPYKYSVAMLSRFKKKIYITLTNYEFEYDVGFKRDWIELVEAVNEGIRIYEELIESRKKVPKKRKRFIIV
jgi:hypothetical protein